MVRLRAGHERFAAGRAAQQGLALGLDLYLCSNTVWSAFALVTGTYGLFVQQLGFTATSLYGLYRHTQYHRDTDAGKQPA